MKETLQEFGIGEVLTCLQDCQETAMKGIDNTMVEELKVQTNLLSGLVENFYNSFSSNSF